MSTDNVAIVTGAASGIGLATVRLLRERGYAVVAVDLSVEQLGVFGGDDVTATLAGDVTDESVNVAAVALAEERFGGVDAMILNAGVRGSGDIVTMELDVFDRAIDVNLRAAMLGMRASVPALRRRSTP